MRAELNPRLLSKFGVGLDPVRTALSAANANIAKGELSDDVINSWTIEDNDQTLYRRPIPQADCRLQQRRAGAPG